MELTEALGFEDSIEIIAWVRGIARRTACSQNPEFQDELVSIGLLELVKIKEKIDPKQYETFKSYAFVRARGAMIDFIRREARWYRRVKHQDSENETQVVERLPHYNHPENELLLKESQKIIHAAVHTLPDAMQTIVQRCFYYGDALSDLLKLPGFKSLSWISKQKTKACNQLSKVSELRATYLQLVELS